MFGKLKLGEKLSVYTMLTVLSLIWAVPLAYLLWYSWDGAGWGNYDAVIRLDLFPRFLINSVIVAVCVVSILLIVVALAAFGFSKMKFPGRHLLFNLALVGMMIPASAMLVPLFQTIKGLGWMNSYMSLIGPEVALMAPFALLITRNFFDEIPNELFEAARIDGAGTMSQFVRIILPLGVPILATAGIIVFLHSWNEYLMPLAFINDKSMLTITMAPQYFIEEYTADYNKVFAAMVLMSVPIVVLYLFGQKYLQRGLTSGALK
ncbi:carbohydrate ABC transporter permease [Paenibacillus koleovorans]|uniref:carbohydrate ABC transporter permease n=1 Tax=Paenibacillus koleovorans TaxID=121608 RepID=UPI000FD6C10E|nr:carbohydrate ABC transporter permease [Paenibacillus koleovorans]